MKTLLINKHKEAKKEFEEYNSRLNYLLNHYNEMYAKDINFSNPEKVKNLNSHRSDRDKRKIVLLIYFNIEERHQYDNTIRFDHDSKIIFRMNEYGYPTGYIVDMSSKAEMQQLFNYILKEEVWIKAVKRRETKLGFKEWKESFNTEKFKWNTALSEYYTFDEIKLPRLLSKKYLIVCNKEQLSHVI